jgi:hypothetical protein
MRYTMDRSGIGKMMRSDAGLHRRLREVAQQQLGAMSRRAPRSAPGSGGRPPGELARSGRVEDLGVRPVFRGEPRMTMAVVFHAPYAAIVERRTHFMLGTLQYRPDPPERPGGGR